MFKINNENLPIIINCLKHTVGYRGGRVIGYLEFHYFKRYLLWHFVQIKASFLMDLAIYTCIVFSHYISCATFVHEIYLYLANLPH